MTSSLFDSFSSSNVPSNPTVPPSAPPGFTAPSSNIANPSTKSPPMTSAQIAAIQQGMQENNLQSVVQALSGAYVPTSSAFDQLEAWAEGVYTDIVNYAQSIGSALTGLGTAAWDDITQMFSDIENWATQLSGGVQQILTWWNSLINGLLGSSAGGTGSVYDLTTWLQNAEANANAAWTELQDFLTTGDWSDLSAAWQDILQAIFGSNTTPPLTSWIPASWVVNSSTNSQPVPDFPNVASLATVSYNGGGWAPGPGFSGSAGSAVCTANGSPWLLTGVPIPVQPGQVAQRAALVQWSGLAAATGTSPIQLQLIPWSSTGGLDPQPDAPGTAVTITEITSPAASGGPTEMSGQYTVPDSGVGYVQAAILVTADAAAGTVSWTNCTTAIEGGFLPQLQAGFEQLQADAQASQAATQTFLQAIKTATTNDAGNFGQWWTDVSAAYQTWATTESGLAANEFATLQQMFNAAMGLNTTTGQISGSNVSSSTGLASLEADWNKVVAFWDNLLGIGNDPTTSQVLGGSVTGAGGQLNILTAVEAGWDQLVQAFTGKPSSGNGLGQLANAAALPAAQAAYAQELAQSATMVQAQQATAKPGYMAIDSTMDAVFPLSHMLVNPTYISVTKNASAMGYICVPDNVAKLSVAFVGSYTGTLTGLYINIYSMSASTGALTSVTTGTNIVSSVGTASQWTYYDLPSALTAQVGDWFAVEMVVTGSGTYSLMGVPAALVPANTSVYPQSLGGFRSNLPAHDATGAGYYIDTTATSYSWSHTLGTSATGIIIAFETNVGVSSVTVGGVAATLLGSASGGRYLYGLLNPPTGTKTVAVNLSSSGYFLGNSDSYTGVTSFGTVATSTGSSGSASVTVASGIGQTAVGALFAAGGAVAITGFNQTQRWSASEDTTYGGAFGDAPGASTVTFSGSTGAPWAGIGVSLIGAPSPTPPVSIPTPYYTNDVPWFGLGTSAIDNHPVYAPEPHAYYMSGSYTLTVPSWAMYADVIALGAGGGAGGGLNGAGSPGGNTTITVGANTVTGNGGAAGAGGTTTTPDCYGYSPHNETYNGVTYYGGTQVALGQDGSSPGGGGGGSYYGGLVGHAGHAGSYSANTYTLSGISSISITVGAGGLENNIGGSPSYGAAPGADGAAWVVFRQS